MLESLFNKVAGLKASNFIKKIFQQRRFSVHLAKFLRTPFFKEHLQWLLLYIEAIIYFLLHNLHDCTFDPIQDGPHSGLLTDRVGGAKRLPTLKSVTHFPTMMTLGTVTIYLEKIKKIYKSRDIHLDFCRYQLFFIGKQQLLLYQEIQIQIAF